TQSSTLFPYTTLFRSIFALMNVDAQNLRGAKTAEMNLRAIETKIKKDPFIAEADLYADLKGNLVASVALRRPIARIIRNDGPDGDRKSTRLNSSHVKI